MTDPRTRPIAMSIGDVAGIGPEIIVKYFNRKKNFPPVIIPAPPAVLRRIFNVIPPVFSYETIDTLPQSFTPNTVYFLNLPGSITETDVASGKLSKAVAETAVASVQRAVELCLAGTCSSLVTMPVNKAVFTLAGQGFSGHTEFLQKKTKASLVIMLLWSEDIKVVPMTRHLPLAEVAGALPVRELGTVFHQVNELFRRLDRKSPPKFAVLSLNPHNGEDGACGREEFRIREQLPRLQTGFDITGTFSPDSFFGRKLYEKYDVVIGWYHDQVLIPFKLLAMGSGINITLGLPFLRVSVDHGCGYDIAPRFCADPSSLAAVMKFLAQYSS